MIGRQGSALEAEPPECPHCKHWLANHLEIHEWGGCSGFKDWCMYCLVCSYEPWVTAL